jgi:hypothetical protein
MLPLLGPSAKQLAQASTNSILQEKLFQESPALTEAIHRLTEGCQDAIARVRNEGASQSLRGKKLRSLTKLLKSGVALNLNMRTSRISYEFLPIQSGSDFDEEMMDSVGSDEEFEANEGKRPSVLFALTKAMVEVNEHGEHARCIAKAKVFLTSQGRVSRRGSGREGDVMQATDLVMFSTQKLQS